MAQEDWGLVIVPPPHLSLIYQACHRCFRQQPSNTSFKRCSRCRRVCYDTVECQKADWKLHKEFCAAYTTMIKDKMLDPPSGEPSHDMSVLARRSTDRTVKKERVLESILKRSLSPSEKNLLSWEPRCLACARTEDDIRASVGGGAPPVKPLIPCQKCKLSFYCSDAHRDFAHHKHENVPDNDSVEGLSQCALNQVVRTDLVYKELVRRDASDPPAPWIPYRVKSRWESLEGCSWATEYESALAAYEAPDRLGPSLRQATDSLSFAQTILWALEKLNPDDAWTRKEILTVHLMGAACPEAGQALVFEEILHRLPEVKTLKILFCGPDMDCFVEEDLNKDVPLVTCRDCSSRGRRRIHCYVAKKYHEYVASLGPAYTVPDLAIAFNSGVGNWESDSWFPTARLLVEKKVPAVFTAYNRGEVAQDRKLLTYAGAKLLPGLVGRNPWGSQLIQTEPTQVHGFYSSNMFISGAFK